MTTLKTLFIGFFGLFHFPFFFFLFLFLQHKKRKKQKMQFSFRKPHFWHPQNFAKTLFWHNVTLFVFSKIPPKHYKNGEKTVKKNLDQFLTLDLDQFLTLETPNLGPVFNSTAYIYIYIYIYFFFFFSFLSLHKQSKTSPIPVSWMCVKPSGTIKTLKLQHQKTLHKLNPWQFQWCNVLHHVTSTRFPPILFCLWCFLPQW